MKELMPILATVVAVLSFAAGVLFAKPTKSELAALQALAEGEAAKALAIYNRVKGAL